MKKMSYSIVFALLGLCSLASCKKDHILTTDEQLKKDVAAIDEYLAAHSITAVTDDSGLRYTVTSTGTGLKPHKDGIFSVKYSAHVLGSTTVFNESEDGINLKLDDNLITGWIIAMPYFTKGSKVVLYLPSGLAFGATSGTNLPAFSNVVFEIELLDDDAQLAADVAAIDAYIADSLHIDSDIVHADPSGVRYIFNGGQGTGSKPLTTSTIVVKYTGKSLNPTQTFVSQTTQQSVALSDLMWGWQEALVNIPAGSNFKLFIPSTLGYGPSGLGDVGKNKNLYFEINLVSTN